MEIINEEPQNEPKEKRPHVVIRNTAEYQRMKLEKLMQNPDKPVIIPEKPQERGSPHIPDFVRNVMGSSAGAGSGEFHVYRHLRRKEYARQKYMQAKADREKKDDEYREKLEEYKRQTEERTAKKRAKRLKKKNKLKSKAKKTKMDKKESSSEGLSDSDRESDEESDNNDRNSESGQLENETKEKEMTDEDCGSEKKDNFENRNVINKSLEHNEENEDK